MDWSDEFYGRCRGLAMGGIGVMMVWSNEIGVEGGIDAQGGRQGEGGG